MKQTLLKNRLTFKALGNGNKNDVNNIINKNIASELNDCTITSIEEYSKKKKMKSISNHKGNKSPNEEGPKTNFITTEDDYKILINLKGIKKDNVKLDLVGNYFIISCQKTKVNLSGNEDNKICYYKKSFKLPNDCVTESMQAKLYEDRLEILIDRKNKKVVSASDSDNIPGEEEEYKENFIHDISKMDTNKYEKEGKNRKGNFNKNESSQVNNNRKVSSRSNDDFEHIKEKALKKKTISVSNLVQLNFNSMIKGVKKFTSDSNLFYLNNKNKLLYINSSSLYKSLKVPKKPNKLELSTFLPPELTKDSNTTSKMVKNQRKPQKKSKPTTHHLNKSNESPRKLNSNHDIFNKSKQTCHSNSYVVKNEMLNKYNSSQDIVKERKLSVKSNSDHELFVRRKESHGNSEWVVVSRRKQFKGKSLSTKDSQALIPLPMPNDNTNDNSNKLRFRDPNNYYTDLYLSNDSTIYASTLSFDNAFVSVINVSDDIDDDIPKTNKVNKIKNIEKSKSVDNKSRNQKDINSNNENKSSKSVDNKSRNQKDINSNNENKSSKSPDSKRKSQRNVNDNNENKTSKSTDNKRKSQRDVNDNNKSIHRMVMNSLIPISSSRPQSPNCSFISRQESLKKNNISPTPTLKSTRRTSPTNGIRKNLIPTIDSTSYQKVSPCPRSNSSVSIKNKNLLIHSYSQSDNNPKNKCIYSRSASLTNNKPPWNYGSIKPENNNSMNSYYNVKAEILKRLNSDQKKPLTKLKVETKRTKPVSNMDKREDNTPHNIYNRLRHNSSIPSSPNKCSSPVNKSLLIITNNDNLIIKKSKIPYSPQSKNTITKIDDFIIKSLILNNKIPTIAF
ncbi:hypothetical protein BCR36DRAFT_586764 [Piromyces finnis]|uniref:SHSP domain-containing protein n=1 Tax=Piromyces finnis TaxID=1754191 RepID=A0A1Y1UZH1_9FUNG|nr:hypothetical protein BCR36DRAFT_586764 [Piromyces finnis]|eukprot:ORX43284.1 hypothetical protein BCR36DRAFT_586764 [Piromyces finnis]